MENASKALIIAGAILISILLITIGIVLIRSGQSITDTGASEMASQTIQTFNAQFSSYVGTVKGSQIKTLLENVRANNSTDKSHQVSVTSSTEESSISATKNYTVKVHYNGDGGWTESSKKIITPANAVSEEGYIDKIDIQ